jgi:TonB family protein
MADALRQCVYRRAVLPVLLIILGAGVQVHAGEASPFAFSSSHATRFDPHHVQPPGTTLIESGARASLVLLSKRPAAVNGSAVLQVSIDQDGIPRTVGLIGSSGEPLLDRAVVSAVRNWKFDRPDRLHGVANGFLLVHAGT